VESTNNQPTGAVKKDNFDEKVDRCLSMVLDYPEVEQIAAIIKKLHHEKYDLKE
jgi:hypothetical protein